MSDMEAKFVDVSGQKTTPPDLWPAIVIPRAAIDREIERLADADRPANGVRGSKVVHPLATEPGLGLAPGIDVTIHVLRPGEVTEPVRHNSVQISMCIRGTGVAEIGKREFGFERWDVWNTPAMNTYRYRNTGKDLMVKLTYSNAPMLEKLMVHYVEEDPPVYKPSTELLQEKAEIRRARDLAPNIALQEPGARLMGYEYLVDPDVVESNPLIWRWKEVEPYLGRVESLGKDVEGREKYSGRSLFLLYNPATERRNGTNHCFFATIAQMPGGRVDIPHRHTSAAINYYFRGRGRSTVAGERYEWDEGDLMLSAPGWAVHNHAAVDTVNALTIQDHPLHLATESLVWQETLKSPILKLGSELGAQTNLHDLAPAE